MSPGAKMEYLKTIYSRYKEATRKEKSIILNEFCQNCNYHRKHAIRRLKTFKPLNETKPKKKGKPTVYHKDSITKPLKRIWLTSDLPCSKRLKVILPLWLPYYPQQFGELLPETVEALHRISPATIDRLLKSVRIRYRKHGKASTKPGTLLKKHIPIKTDQWDESRPGFLEADTVAHCGESLAGMFAYTIDCVDIATGWTEQRAVWGKGEKGVLEQIKDIENHLPFPLLGFDSDNGSEFLNNHLLHHLTTRKQPIQFTRSRPYHKDDNSHVEQKNWTHVRQWFGYHRLDDPQVIPLMNDLYTSQWRWYHNLFLPSAKLLDKKRVASKIIKRYDTPKTPYQRIMESPYAEASVKSFLKEQFAILNPFRLRKAMEIKLSKIFNLIHKNNDSI